MSGRCPGRIEPGRPAGRARRMGARPASPSTTRRSTAGPTRRCATTSHGGASAGRRPKRPDPGLTRHTKLTSPGRRPPDARRDLPPPTPGPGAGAPFLVARLRTGAGEAPVDSPFHAGHSPFRSHRRSHAVPGGTGERLRHPGRPGHPDRLRAVHPSRGERAQARPGLPRARSRAGGQGGGHPRPPRPLRACRASAGAGGGRGAGRRARRPEDGQGRLPPGGHRPAPVAGRHADGRARGDG